jgi:hypothetical protein
MLSLRDTVELFSVQICTQITLTFPKEKIEIDQFLSF